MHGKKTISAKKPYTNCFQYSKEITLNFKNKVLISFKYWKL